MRKILGFLPIGIWVRLICLIVVSSVPTTFALAQTPEINPSNTIENNTSEAIVYVTLSEEGPPVIKFMNDKITQTQAEQAKVSSIEYTGPIPQYPPPTMPGSNIQEIVSTNASFADNWNLLFTENFEGSFPQSSCFVRDRSSDGKNRYWGSDDFNPASGVKAGWPARGGTNGVDPATNPYSVNLKSWLTCGPFDFRNAQRLLVRFDRWLQINDPDDFLFVGVSLDSLNHFDGVQSTGVNTNWRTMNIYFDGTLIEDEAALWVSWYFQSDNNGPTGQGAWIDNLEIWRYNTPVDACGPVDPGIKGVVVDPYETVGAQTVPIIRSGHTQVVDGLLAADAGLVRMLFQQRNGVVQLQEYDRMFDTLCVQGINMLGVVNQETLVRQDYNVPATAASYREEFANTVDLLANHFEERIYYWEIWNEQDLGPDNPNGPFIAPELYAPLLVETRQTLQQNNRPVSLLYGGLSSAWDRSFNYFVTVYDELRILGAVGLNSPFFYLSIHPYPDPNEVSPQTGGLNPDIYLHAIVNPNHTTILDKFMQTMADPQIGETFKRVWITEIGWNSAGDDPGAPLTCWQELAVTDQEQATYLKDSFDILFSEVKYWGYSGFGSEAVDKVIWYQYRDIGVDDEAICGLVGANASPQTIWEQRVPLGYIPKTGNITSQGTVIAWHFGLYTGNEVDPKPAQCVFAAYPSEGNCAQNSSGGIFLPIIKKNSSN